MLDVREEEYTGLRARASREERGDNECQHRRARETNPVAQDAIAGKPSS